MSSSRTRVPAASGPTQFAHPTPGWSYPGTAPGPAEARHDAASPPAAPVTQPAALELGPDGVPYIRKPDGRRNGLVETTTGPGREIEFPGLAPLTAAVRNAVQYIVSHADLEARPPRLWPVDSTPYITYCGWGGSLWGRSSNLRGIVRVDVGSMVATTGHEFPAGTSIDGIFAGQNAVFVLATADNKSSLYRTSDGVALTLVHDLGRDPDGATHWPYVTLMGGGLRAGIINGQPALMFATYNIMDTAGGVAGTQGDAIYVAYSMDDGQTWQRLNTWTWDYTTGTGVRHIRHFHAVMYDQWRGGWWICGGDTDTQSCVIYWDGKAPGPGNVSPAQMQAGSVPGWQCRTGSQRWRAVDIIVTEDWIETFTDTVDINISGIWRMRPNFTQSHRIYYGTPGMMHDGWFGLLLSDGSRIWCDNCRVEAEDPTHRFIGIYGSKTGDRYYHIGKLYTDASGKRNMYAMYEYMGKVWMCHMGPIGRAAQYTTAFTLRGKFREEQPDNLGPVYFVDPVAGNDSNSGTDPRAAWKTVRKCLQGNVVTYGARVMVAPGESVENGLSTIVYAANAQPAADTTARVQISGQGRDATIVTLSGATEGWRGASNVAWNIELSDMTLRQSDPSKNLIWDNSTATAGKPRVVLRDARLGGRGATEGGWNSIFVRNADVFVYRSEILTPPRFGAATLRPDGAGTIRLVSSLISGARSVIATTGLLDARHCEFADYTYSAIELPASTTQAPTIINSVFSGLADVFLNNAGLSLASTVYGNLYTRTQPEGTPAPILPAAGIMDRDEITRAPFEWSAIAGLAQPAGVEWDYYGNPFRARPAIGAAEIPPAI